MQKYTKNSNTWPGIRWQFLHCYFEHHDGAEVTGCFECCRHLYFCLFRLVSSYLFIQNKQWLKNLFSQQCALKLPYLHILGFYTWLDKFPGHSDLRDYRKSLRTARSSRRQYSYYQWLKCKVCPVLKMTPKFNASLYFNRDFEF